MSSTANNDLNANCKVFDNYGEDDMEEDEEDNFLSGFHCVPDPNELKQNVNNLAPYLPTPGVWLDDVLQIANTIPSDVVCDVGCGDGRIPIWAVQRFNAKKAIGIDIDENLITRCKKNAKERGIPDTRIEFLCGDATKLDDSFFDEITVLVVYLIPDSFPILKDIFLKFLKSKNGVGNNNKRCVVIGWQLDGWRIVKTKAMGEDNMSTSQSVYLYDSTSI
jgi:SAM-dependent methyltransferase